MDKVLELLDDLKFLLLMPRAIIAYKFSILLIDLVLLAVLAYKIIKRPDKDSLVELYGKDEEDEDENKNRLSRVFKVIFVVAVNIVVMFCL